jgi:hypothetical protein
MLCGPRFSRIVLLTSRRRRAVRPGEAWIRRVEMLARGAASEGAVLVGLLGPLPHEVALQAALDAGGCVEIVEGPLADDPVAAALRLGADPRRIRMVPPAGSGPLDQAAAARADRVVVVEARPGGNVEAIAGDRLRRALPIAVCLPAPARTVNEALVRAGAAPLLPDDDPAASAGAAAVPPVLVGGGSAVVPGDDDWLYLVHFTRGCPGAYPGQGRDEFLRELRGPADAGFHGPARSLERIVREGCVRASGRWVSGGTPVVSFTAAPPSEWPGLRRWVRHLGRWTFERYGIAIRRDVLAARGARPVRYGPTSRRPRTAAGRVFFQVRRSGGSDWSREREWRHPGSLVLGDLPPGSTALVVPAEGDATRLLRSPCGRPAAVDLPAPPCQDGIGAAASAAGPGSRECR